MAFVWNIKKGAIPFTPKEDMVAKWFLKLLIKECPKTCSFLTILNVDTIKFFWSPVMDPHENGIMGAWCVTTPRNVYMVNLHLNRNVPMYNNKGSNVSRSGEIKDLYTCQTMMSLMDCNVGMTLVHELIHMLQFKASPIGYVFNRLVTLFVDRVPYLEQIGIEYDARVNSETDELIEFLRDLNHSITSYFSAIQSQKSTDPDNWLYKHWAGVGRDEKPHTDKIMRITKEYFDLINKDI